jgi:YVTN family beta-propeller protein
VALGRDGRSVYVAALGPGEVSMIDTSTHHVSATLSVGPHGTDPFNVAVASSAIYVTEQGADTLTVIDPKTFKVVATVTVGTSPYGVAATP